MKKLLFFLTFISLAFYSCDDEVDEPQISADPTAALITSPADGATITITEESLLNELKIEWEAADYGVNTPVTYVVEIDSATNGFEWPVVLSTTNETLFTLTMQEFNNKLISGLKLPKNTASTIEIRIVSSINEEMEEISEVISITATPWEQEEEPAPATLWVPGGYQDYNPAAAPVIYAISETEFEGFVYINEASGFKFTSAPDWDHTNYGDSGTPGTLSTDSQAPDLSAGEPGYYRFRVNTEDLTYEMYRVTTFGLIGTATEGGWNTSTAMNFDEETNLWTLTADLAAGALKFRANDSWDVNYGPADSESLTGTLVSTDAAISIHEAGTYDITLDFTKSEAPYEYAYEVVKTGDAPPPTTLWVPGSHQEWNPATAPVLYSTSETTFEGYINFEAASEFKFTSAPNWEGTNYGFSDTEGALNTDPLAGNLSVSEAGYYRIKVDVENLTYEVYRVESFGIIGTATAGGWDSSTVMSFDEETGDWTVTADLVNGALKFRANNSWDVNYGPQDSNAFEGKLIQTDAAISIAENGNYTVTINLTRENESHDYTYKVVKN